MWKRNWQTSSYKTIDLKCHYIYNRAASLIILFQNMTSLVKLQTFKHTKTTRQQTWIFVETRLSSKDKKEDLLLPGFSLKRFDWKSSRRRLHTELLCIVGQVESVDYFLWIIVWSVCERDRTNTHQTEFWNTSFVGLYSFPKSSVNQLIRVLEIIHVKIAKTDSEQAIVFCDFNISKIQKTDALLLWHKLYSTTLDIHGPSGETRCPKGVSVSCLASHTRHKCPRHHERPI